MTDEAAIAGIEIHHAIDDHGAQTIHAVGLDAVDGVEIPVGSE
jgi:hypothetical protein